MVVSLASCCFKTNNECPGQIPKVKAILSLYKIKKKGGWRERLLYILMNLIYVVSTYNTSDLSQRYKLNLKVKKIMSRLNVTLKKRGYYFVCICEIQREITARS